MNDPILFDHVSKSFKIHHEKIDSIFDQITKFSKKNYETLTVLNDISFSVKKGETFGILGKNGSGKTTILKLISKIYLPDKGIIKTEGHVIPLLQLGIGFHPELTAVDNIITYGIILGHSKKWIKSKVNNILKYAELEKFADVKIKNFSTGMYSRLAFATVIQLDPELILVDEVLAVGDLSFQEKGLKSFENFKKQGKTTVYISHDPNQILRICDRAMIINDSKIEKIGNTADVVDYYVKMIGNGKT